MKIFAFKSTYWSIICNSRRTKIPNYLSTGDWFSKSGYNQAMELSAAAKSEDRYLYILLWSYIGKSKITS